VSATTCIAVGLVLIAELVRPGIGSAQQDPERPPSLKTVPVPGPANLADFVRDREVAIVLGKALFWDMQVGSDGVQACATCHFNAGADSRVTNQMNPGLLRVNPDGSPNPDRSFTQPFGPNRTLQASDFPLSPRSNDVVSSQGVSRQAFLGISGRPADRTRTVPDADGFRIGATNVRRVEGRNAPTVVNAVFNYRSFWDGRADNVFNGVNGLGDRDPEAMVYRADDPRQPVPVRVHLEDASLASQAVSPPLNTTEMSAEGRTFHDVGAKLARSGPRFGSWVLGVRPLARQLVHPDDGVLGPLSRAPLPGLQSATYEDLVKLAFEPIWWNAEKLLRVAPDGSIALVDGPDGDPRTSEYTLLQWNFALFFGLAVQMYETTLVADDSPYDRFMDGDATAVDPLAVAGVDVFRSQARGRCINCHEDAELTGASVRRVRASPIRIRNDQALDRGFNNIGVLPTLEDLGVGGFDTLGNFLSTTRRTVPLPPEPIAVDGAMKVPGLRNVALTAPYFHNGGFLTLDDVLAFYSRGGDIVPQYSADGTLEISPLNVLNSTPDEARALKAFLLALTDPRVPAQRAPFDHPELFVPDGAFGTQRFVFDDGTGRAIDHMRRIPAVGRLGGPPLAPFAAELRAVAGGGR